MAHIVELPTFGDHRGVLSVVEKILPFEVKRFYFIYDVTCKRGGHRHKTNRQALLCVGGSCEIYVHNGKEENIFLLDKPCKCLLLDTHDWHTMDKFSEGSTLLVFASEYYDINDYIDEAYE